jgi:hypothetical protein
MKKIIGHNFTSDNNIKLEPDVMSMGRFVTKPPEPKHEEHAISLAILFQKILKIKNMVLDVNAKVKKGEITTKRTVDKLALIDFSIDKIQESLEVAIKEGLCIEWKPLDEEKQHD